MSNCCQSRLLKRAANLRKLIAQDEKRLERRKRTLNELAVEIRNPQHLPTLCAECDSGE